MKNLTWSITQIGWFMGTIAASAAVMLVFYPFWLIVMLMAVLIAHELGHFGAAKLLGAKAAMPMFIPLGPLALGATWIPTKENFQIRAISMAGPMAGLLVSVALSIAFVLVGSNIGLMFAGGMALRELFAATFGSDGRKFRKAKGEEESVMPSTHFTVPASIHAEWGSL
ncbi:MAG: hypothetical protein RJA41_727 [Actinomycetota bacterium]|jgi:hypothetical protein